MTKKLNLIRRSCLAAGLLCAAGAYAGTAQYDFNTDPIADGLLTFTGPGYWNPSGGASGGANDGYLVVTEATGQSSRIIFNDFDNGKVVKAFTFEADFRIGNGSESPADGFSVSFARSNDPVLTGGAFAGGQNCEAGLAEEGTQTGIAIGFDAWNSGGTAGALCDVVDQSIGLDVAALTVRVDKILVAQFPLPTRNGSCSDVTSLQTGPYEAGGDPSNLCWAKLKVELLENAQLNVWWKGKQMLTNYQTAYFPSPGVLVFGGRTGDAWQNQHVDNIKITTVVEEADTEKPTVPTSLTAVSTGAGRVELSWGASTDNSGRVAYEVDRDGVIVSSVVQTNHFVDFPGQTSKQYTYRVRAKDIAPNFSDWASLSVTTGNDVRPVPGTLKVEIFDGITGVTIADLTGNAKFTANTPDRAAYIGSLQAGSANGTAGWNESYGDNYGLRITGVLTPIETGEYDFFIRSDDASALYLNQSGAALPNPLTDTALIEETGCCAAFLEPADGDAATTSAPVSLTAGQSYGFVVLMKEGGGGDGVAVGMRKAGETTPAAANIPAIGGGLILSGSGDPVGAALGFTTQPGNVTTFANEKLTLRGAVTNASYYTSSVWYQWLRDGKPVVGATASTYTIPVLSSSDNAAKFALVAGTLGIAKTSSVATVTVNADTRKPLLAKALGGEALNSVDVTFSEPVKAPSATTAANYTFDKGLTASAASLVDQFTVRVTTSKQTEGTVYTLTVNNVADNAGNAIEANSTLVWKAVSLLPSRAKMEIWSDITGTALQGLYDDANYQAGTPDTIIYTPGMNTPDRADNYGARVTGYLIPKESGSFNFFLRSDDASELYLSSNDVFPTVPGATPIAQETDCCEAFVEPGTMNDDTTTSATTSTPVALTAGTRYAMVATLKEGGGGDYLQVALRKVGDTNAAASLTPLSDVIYWFGPDANVLAASNAIVASSTNSPAAEQAPNAIDANPATKYLNFDKLNSGFTVTPASATTVRGIALTSANDAPERDPASFEVWGSANGTAFTKIAEGTVPAFPDRFVRREFFFDNTKAYTSYKIVFPTVANAGTANSMQIADVELLGFVGGALGEVAEGPSVSVARGNNGELVLTFQGTLESTDSLVGGTWTTVSTTSPATVQPTGAMKFFRSR